MKLTINYTELQNYIERHFHVKVSFTRVDENTVCVSLSQKVFIKTIQINLNLHIDIIDNDSITISYDNGIGIDLIISGVLLFIKKKLPYYEGLIKTDGTNRMQIYLRKINNLQPLMQFIDIQNIHFADSSVEVDMQFKS